jgi:hypothetical protein
MPLSRANLAVLQAASEVLNQKRPSSRSVEILDAYAKVAMPQKAHLPLDELATLVALNLMGADVLNTSLKSK